MPSRPSYLSTVAAHLASLGLAEGESIPNASEIARAVGITKGGVKRLLRELRVAGVLHEDTRTPGAPPVVHYPDILAAMGTPEGITQYRQGRQDAKDEAAAGDDVDAGGAVDGDSAPPVAPVPPPARKAVSLGGGSPEAWQLVIGRFDRIVAALEGGEGATRELLAEIRTLPDRIAEAVAARLAGLFATAPKQVRDRTQTDPGDTPAKVAALIEALGSVAEVAGQLGVHADSVRRLARGARGPSAKVAANIERLLNNLKKR